MGRGLGTDESTKVESERRQSAFVVYTVQYDREKAEREYAGDVFGAPKWIAIECVPSLGDDIAAEIERVGETAEDEDLITISYTITAGRQPLDHYIDLVKRTLTAHDLVLDVLKVEKRR